MSNFFVAEVTYKDETKQIGLVRKTEHIPSKCAIIKVHNDYYISQDSSLREGIAKKVVPLHEITITDEDTVSTELTVLDLILPSKVAMA